MAPFPVIRVVHTADREQILQRIKLTALQQKPVHCRQQSVASFAVHERATIISRFPAAAVICSECRSALLEETVVKRVGAWTCDDPLQ